MLLAAKRLAVPQQPSTFLLCFSWFFRRKATFSGGHEIVVREALLPIENALGVEVGEDASRSHVPDPVLFPKPQSALTERRVWRRLGQISPASSGYEADGLNEPKIRVER